MFCFIWGNGFSIIKLSIYIIIFLECWQVLRRGFLLFDTLEKGHFFDFRSCFFSTPITLMSLDKRLSALLKVNLSNPASYSLSKMFLSFTKLPIWYRAFLQLSTILCKRQNFLLKYYFLLDYESGFSHFLLAILKNTIHLFSAQLLFKVGSVSYLLRCYARMFLEITAEEAGVCKMIFPCHFLDTL